jgi:hypothetical protein
MADCRVLARHPTLWRADAPQQTAASAERQLPAAPALALHMAPLEILRVIAKYCESARDLLSFSAVCKTTRCAAAALLSRLPICAACPAGRVQLPGKRENPHADTALPRWRARALLAAAWRRTTTSGVH